MDIDGNASDYDDQFNDEIQKQMTADNLHAMMRQELTGKYHCADYLSMTAWQQNAYQLLNKEQPKYFQQQPDQQQQPGGGSSTSSNNARIDEYCREQIVEWSFRVVDYFRIDREVVAFSLSFLDRFLTTCRCDRTTFKLAATTTLHLAVKLLYPCKLADLGILSDLSRGEFDMKDVSEMETHILRALQWNLHPPSSITFSSLFLDYFFATRVVTMSTTDLDDIYDVSSFFCELAVCDYYFVPISGSSTALASILNALEGMFGPDNGVSPEILNLARELKLCVPQDLAAVRNRLWELYERSEECALHNDKVADEEHNQAQAATAALWQGSIFVKKMSTLSPVSVAATKPCHSATDIICGSGTHHNNTSHACHTSTLRNGSW